jgi:RNA polymerase sigma-70 factor (ECF subfamily)
MRSEAEADRAVEKYADTVRRVCFMYLKNYSDVEDVFQEVFLKYILHDQPFISDDHEKSWLIRVSINSCKDVLKSFFRRKVCSLEEVDTEPFYLQEDERYILDAVLKLPDNYRSVIYLFYYEGYTAVEIAKILNKRENTIYTWLSRAKSKLKGELGGDHFE